MEKWIILVMLILLSLGVFYIGFAAGAQKCADGAVYEVSGDE